MKTSWSLITVTAIVTAAAFIIGTLDSRDGLQKASVSLQPGFSRTEALQWLPAVLSSGVLGWSTGAMDVARQSDFIVVWVSAVLAIFSVVVVLTNVQERELKRIAGSILKYMPIAAGAGWAASQLAA